jgi:hypothetical protein
VEMDRVPVCGMWLPYPAWESARSAANIIWKMETTPTRDLKAVERAGQGEAITLQEAHRLAAEWAANTGAVNSRKTISPGVPWLRAPRAASAREMLSKGVSLEAQYQQPAGHGIEGKPEGGTRGP